jgi:Cu+-exporting ATPase
MGLRRIALTVIGVPCASCIIPIRKALRSAKGVKWVGANYMLDLILVDYDPALTSEQEIIGAIRKAGFEAVPNRLI